MQQLTGSSYDAFNLFIFINDITILQGAKFICFWMFFCKTYKKFA
jgi:hypothetical protein